MFKIKIFRKYLTSEDPLAIGPTTRRTLGHATSCLSRSTFTDSSISRLFSSRLRLAHAVSAFAAQGLASPHLALSVGNASPEIPVLPSHHPGSAVTERIRPPLCQGSFPATCPALCRARLVFDQFCGQLPPTNRPRLTTSRVLFETLRL